MLNFTLMSNPLSCLSPDTPPSSSSSPAETPCGPCPVWLQSSTELLPPLPARRHHPPAGLLQRSDLEGPLSRTSGALSVWICPAAVSLTISNYCLCGPSMKMTPLCKVNVSLLFPKMYIFHHVFHWTFVKINAKASGGVFVPCYTCKY